MGTLKEVKERLEEIVKYGANTGSVSFCIYTKDNNNLIKNYLNEVFDYINEQRDNYNIILENGDEVVFSVIDDFCYKISYFIEANIKYENENEENINTLLNYIKNEYDYARRRSRWRSPSADAPSRCCGRSRSPVGPVP